MPVNNPSISLADEFVTTASADDLTNQVVIPGLAGSADIAGAGGGGTSREFDASGDAAPTWSTSPDTTVDIDTTSKSHLYVKDATNTVIFGDYVWSPSGAFNVIAKVSLGRDATTTSASCGIWVGNSDDSSGIWLILAIDSGGTTATYVKAATRASSTDTQRGSNSACGGNNSVYLKLSRDGSNNCSFALSTNGISWFAIATQALTFTVAHLGFRIASSAAVGHEMFVDFLRTDV